MKFSGYVLNGTKNKRLDFRSDPDHYQQKYEIEGGKARSVLMVGFESPGIELP